MISRSIDVGQTVQASFSAPELFLIAGDLARMQILVAVDESDIGQIVEGQTARFTVQAYPDDTFTGTVRQVRLQSIHRGKRGQLHGGGRRGQPRAASCCRA